MKTFLHIAIFTFQLDECLRVGRTVHPQATLAPDADDAVVLGLQVFQQSDSPLAKRLIAHVVSIGIQERADGIDDQQLTGRMAQLLGALWRGMAEGIVVFQYSEVSATSSLLTASTVSASSRRLSNPSPR